MILDKELHRSVILKALEVSGCAIKKETLKEMSELVESIEKAPIAERPKEEGK